MNEYSVKILGIGSLAANTFNIKVEKPKGYIYTPGQFANISLIEGVKLDEKESFCFVGLVEASHLEFIIKLYNQNDLLKKAIVGSSVGDKLKISESHGTFKYKGMGVFIVAGTGITPAIAILRDLKHKKDLAGNMLIYSNGTMNDVILNTELSQMLGMDYINVFTKERYEGYFFGRIDKNFLRMQIVDFVRYFYVCGSLNFVQDMRLILKEFNIPSDSIIFEDAILNSSISKNKTEDIINIGKQLKIHEGIRNESN